MTYNIRLTAWEEQVLDELQEKGGFNTRSKLIKHMIRVFHGQPSLLHELPQIEGDDSLDRAYELLEQLKRDEDEEIAFRHEVRTLLPRFKSVEKKVNWLLKKSAKTKADKTEVKELIETESDLDVIFSED